MAGKKSTKTSKTDHVLNLLAGASSQEAVKRPADPAQAAAEPVQTTEAPVREAALQEDHPPAATQGRHLMPPILEVARSNNEALSESRPWRRSWRQRRNLCRSRASPSRQVRALPLHLPHFPGDHSRSQFRL